MLDAVHHALQWLSDDVTGYCTCSDLVMTLNAILRAVAYSDDVRCYSTCSGLVMTSDVTVRAVA